MPDYRINILINGKDNASGALRNVGGALGNMAQIAGGILGANLFSRITNTLQGVGRQAIQATASLQGMQVGMEGLIAREIAMASQTEAASKKTTEGILTIAEAMPLAESKAKGLVAELENIAIASPYQIETINGTFRQAMAFGFSTEMAKGYTKALLNVAAGTGANNEMMGRMAYNLAQIKLQGQITSVDMRQLAMAGFDLGGVIQYVSDKYKLNIKDHKDLNKALASGKITMEDFFKSFEQYAEENFGGASERMSRTLNGLQSTFADVFTLTLPKIIGPAVEKFTAFAGGILDSVLKIRDSGLLEQLEKVVTGTYMNMEKAITPIVRAITNFFDLLARGVSPAKAFRVMMGTLFMPEQKNQIFEAMEVVGAFIDTIRLLATGEFKGGPFGLNEENDALINSLKRVRGYLIDVGNWVKEHIAPLIRLKDVIAAIGIVILAALVPALLSVATTVLPFLALIGVIALLRNAWEKNWGDIQGKVAMAWAFLQPLFAQLQLWLQTNIPLAIAWLTEQWNTVLLPALQAFWSWVQTSLVPALTDIWTWLQTNIPLAIAWLTEQWNTVLLPALQNFWSWVQTTLMPMLNDVWLWLQTNLPLAIDWLTEKWNTVLLPALQNFWSWVETSLLPTIQDIYNWFMDNLPKAVEFLKEKFDQWKAGVDLAINHVLPLIQAIQDALKAVRDLGMKYIVAYWDKYLAPAFTQLGDSVSKVIQPILEDLQGFIKDHVIGTFERLVDWFYKADGGLDGIKKTIQTVIGWLETFTNTLNNLSLPDWLTPGSPTPFENGLVGITSAMKALNRTALPEFAAGLQINGGAGSAVSGQPQIVQNMTLNFGGQSNRWKTEASRAAGTFQALARSV